MSRAVRTLIILHLINQRFRTETKKKMDSDRVVIIL